MPELVGFSFERIPAMKIVGREIRVKMGAETNPIPDFWEKCHSDGTLQEIKALGAAALDGSYVGFMCDYRGDDKTFVYICGIFMKPDCPVPDGLVGRDIAESDVAIGWVRGPEFENYPVAHNLTAEAMKKAGRRADEAASWCAEVYNCPRFTTPQENGDVILDYWIPCL